MKVVKGILMYALIGLGIILALGILLMGIMFLVPSFKVFGYGFVHNTKETTPKVLVFSNFDSSHNMTDVVLNIKASKGVNVHIVADDSNTAGSIVSKVYNHYYGFYKGERRILISEPEYTYSGTTLTYNVNVYGVEGAIIYSENCYLEVKVPRRQLTATGAAENTALSYHVNLQTENGSVSMIGTSENGAYTGVLQTKSINFSSIKGSLILDGVGSGTGGNTNLSLTELDITSTKSGKFDFGNCDNVTVTGALTLNGKLADFIFKNINVSGGLEIAGDNILFQADNATVAGDIVYQSPLGAFKVAQTLKSTSGEIRITSNSANVTVGTVEASTFGVRSDYGNIKVGTSKASTYLQGGHGNIEITKCTEGLEAHTSYGNITVGEYEKYANFSTNRGAIVAKSTFDNDEVEDLRTTVNLNGKASLNLTTNQIPFTVKATDTSTVNITVKKVKAQNGTTNTVSVVSLAKGTLNVTMPNATPYYVRATGSINGRIGSTSVTNQERIVKYVTETEDERLNRIIEDYKSVYLHTCPDVTPIMSPTTTNNSALYVFEAPKINFSTYM